MLESHGFWTNGLEDTYFADVRDVENLPEVLEFWMAHVARDILRLGVFFRAAVLMCYIPGGMRYRQIVYDDLDDEKPNEEDDPRKWVRSVGRATVLNVLSECLRRLGALHVMKCVPGAEDHQPVELSAEWTAYLDRHAKIKHGLMNVVAECLNALIVEPGMAEIDAEVCPSWWQRWWARME